MTFVAPDPANVDVPEFFRFGLRDLDLGQPGERLDRRVAADVDQVSLDGLFEVLANLDVHLRFAREVHRVQQFGNRPQVHEDRIVIVARAVPVLVPGAVAPDGDERGFLVDHFSGRRGRLTGLLGDVDRAVDTKVARARVCGKALGLRRLLPVTLLVHIDRHARRRTEGHRVRVVRAELVDQRLVTMVHPSVFHGVDEGIR